MTLRILDSPWFLSLVLTLFVAVMVRVRLVCCPDSKKLLLETKYLVEISTC